MANVLNIRKTRLRTTSYHIPRTSPLAANASAQNKLPQPARPTLTATGTLASLASSWGVSFSRRKKPELDSDSLTATPESPTDPRGSSDDHVNADTSASELLKRF
jgi:autophagy-related protein 11